MAGAQATIISKGMRYRKLVINPLESVADLEYCRFCKDEVDVEVQQGKWGKVFVYRKQCRRCGQTIQWGVGRSDLSHPNPDTLNEVAAWLRLTGPDRR